MKIQNLKIENFKAARFVELNQIGDVVLVAGPNGCGKSCVLDAIRFLISRYSTNQETSQQFFSEFQLNIGSEDVRRLFYDKSKPLKIAADIILATSEIKYLKDNAVQLLRRILVRPERQPNPRLQGEFGTLDSKVNAQAEQLASALLAELSRPLHTASLELGPDLQIATADSVVLDTAFNVRDPTNVGIIDYHSANRTYQRERVGGINVNIEQTADRLTQHALFNWQNKYSNIKTEIAAAFIRDLLIEKARESSSETADADKQSKSSILDTMTELFDQFLPGKSFAGPRPGMKGELTFPVTLEDGGEHDIDDLSSGEKELVYGYLRLRNVAPSNSIIMLDEPELHLNPRLVLGLPSFYRRHLGSELNNQIWMTTHSDAFLRDAYKGEGISIFHMNPPISVSAGENQVTAILADNEINRAIVDLVGDIAGFRPGKKVVIFESSQNAGFDAAMTKRLFPDLFEQINAVSGDNKFGVKQLYSALNKAFLQMAVPVDVYAICDRDSDFEAPSNITQALRWDVYHIENYLLHEPSILKVLDDNPSFAKRMTESEVTNGLMECARETLRSLVTHSMRTSIYNSFASCIDLGFDRNIQDPAAGLGEAVSRVMNKIGNVYATDLQQSNLSGMRDQRQRVLEQALADGTWRSEFRGRDILRKFAGRYLRGLPYVAFRDAIVARMGDSGYRPTGMSDVIGQILRAVPSHGRGL
jgi:predicted ATPase